MSIMVPVVGKIRYKAKDVIKQSNFRQVVLALGQYDNDHYKYPATVAKLGYTSTSWSWQPPETMLTSKDAPVENRSVGAYLNSYIDDVGIVHCPHAPGKSKKFEKMWQEGEDFCFEQTSDGWEEVDYRVTGTYCFWWNYEGDVDGRTFRGPEKQSDGARQSRLLISDFFSYGHWRGNYRITSKSSTDKSSYVSCERMPGARKDREDQELQIHPLIWALDKPRVPEVKLYAGYSDGSVLSYNCLDAVKLKVIDDGSGGFGEYYLPRDALR